MIDPAVDFHTHKLAFDWPFRGKGRPGKYGQLPQGMDWKISEWTENLYTIPKDDPYELAPGSKFTWTRIRAVGGRTLVWGRNVDRFGPLDFKPKSLQDGWGDDWPISYEDVAPYYDRVEALIGVSGGSEDVFNTPSGKKLQPPFRPRCGELLIKKGAGKLGIKVLPYPLAVLSQNKDGRAACHYCGACGHGCDTASRFSSLEVLIPRLTVLPNFELRTHAVARTVTMDLATGKARGVTYIDARNNLEYEVRAKSVVLAASMIESIRILFNSKNRDYPDGLANSSGVLGRYLTEHVAFNGIEGFFPQLAGREATNDDGPGEACLYIPRYNYGHKDKKKFLRGYRFKFYTGCDAPGPGADFPGFGAAFKKRVKELYPTGVRMGGFGEGLAFASNYVEIDPGGLCDRFGIPQVRFHTSAEYDHAFAIRDEMYGQMEEILRASGAEIFPYQKAAPYPLGSVTHEAGGCRMGDDPRTSVLDKWCRSHDIKNLFVVDAACFVSHPEKATTHTIMALAYRASDYLADLLRKA
jgi:choline dehydrogenase-like flavoprotein